MTSRRLLRVAGLLAALLVPLLGCANDSPKDGDDSSKKKTAKLEARYRALRSAMAESARATESVKKGLRARNRLVCLISPRNERI